MIQRSAQPAGREAAHSKVSSAGQVRNGERRVFRRSSSSVTGAGWIGVGPRYLFDANTVVQFRRFSAVFSGAISVPGLGDSLRRGAWSLDIFRPCAVVADEVCGSHLSERRFENSPPFQGWDLVANSQSPEGTVELFSDDPLS